MRYYPAFVWVKSWKTSVTATGVLSYIQNGYFRVHVTNVACGTRFLLRLQFYFSPFCSCCSYFWSSYADYVI